MISIGQAILVTLFVFAFKFIGNGTQVFSYASNVLTGWIVGLLMGNSKVGLEIGAMLTLMSLGVGGFGGSSVPDYFLGTVIGTVFGITTGNGLEAALTIGVPVAALGTNLDVLGKTLGSFFIHREIAESDAGNFDKMGRWVFGHLACTSALAALPVFLVMTVGADFITNLIASLPQWFNNGMNVVAGLLPAVGFATLLRFMPLKTYWPYLILGFVLASYLNLPMLAIGLIVLVFAFNEFRNLERESEMTLAASNVVTTAEDIAAGNYDE